VKSLIFTATTIEEALRKAARDDRNLVIDPKGARWKAPPAFAKREPGEEAKIFGSANFTDLLYKPAPTSPLPAAPQSHSAADQRDKDDPGYVPSSPEEERRAHALKRLGGGPVVRDEQRRRHRGALAMKAYMEGIRRRPVA